MTHNESIIDRITPYVLTFNEELNISRCLDKLTWASRVVVLDSFSTDKTKEICSKYPNVDFYERVFISHSDQHSFALSLASSSDWVLRLDADWILTDSFLEWLKIEVPDNETVLYRVPFDFMIHGNRVRLAHYPDASCLFRHKFIDFIQDGHTERTRVKFGRSETCPKRIHHDDRKHVSRFILSQSKYSVLESEKLDLENDKKFSSRLRSLFVHLPMSSIIILSVYYLILKGGFFASKSTKHYIIQRFIAELSITLQSLDKRIRDDS